MTAISSVSNPAASLGGGTLGGQAVLIADVPKASDKTSDRVLDAPVKAAGPDGLIRQAVLTERIYSYGETRYYVNGVSVGQQFKTATAARAEVARRIGSGTMGKLPLAERQQPPQKTSLISLPGDDGIVQSASAGNNTVVELKVRRELRKGVMQDTGYVAVRVSAYSIESYADSRPRTAYGYPLSSQAKNTLIRTPSGGVITDLAQAQQRTRELVASRGLTTVSAAQAKDLSDSNPLSKPVAAMNKLDRVKYLLQETARRLPASVAAELTAMLTSPETLLIMGAFCAAQAIPVVNVAALIVGSLLLGNDILDTGGKMVDAVKMALAATSHADLVGASQGMAEALGHGAVSAASAAVGNRTGKAWKNSTSNQATSLRTLTKTVKDYKAGNATPEQVRRAAIVAMQEKRAATPKNGARHNPATPATASPQATPPTPTPTPTPAPPPLATLPPKRSATSRTPTRQTPPDPAVAQPVAQAVAQAAATQRAVGKASQGIFTDPTLQSQLSQRLAKDSRSKPSPNAAAAIDPQLVQASAVQVAMPKLLEIVFGGRNIPKNAADAFKARATDWAKLESPSNPAGALERLAGAPATQADILKQTVIDRLTGSSPASIKALGNSQPGAEQALAARRQRLSAAIDRAYPEAAGQAQLLQQNAGPARTALMRTQAGVELGGSTPLASAVETQLKVKGAGERDLVKMLSSPQVRISTMKNALVEQWRGSSGQEPLLDAKSQSHLRQAIDRQLANTTGDGAKEQYLKDLSASSQTMARMASAEPNAGAGAGAGAGAATRKVTTQEPASAQDRRSAPQVPASTARRPGESMHSYLERMKVKQSLSAEQQRAADASGMRMSIKPADEPAAGSPTGSSGQTFKARTAALQRDLAATKTSALPQAVLQADAKLLSSLPSDTLANLRSRLAPRGVDLAEGVPQTEGTFKALAALDTAALSGPILRTVGFDFSANSLLTGNATLMKAARGFAVRALAAGQDPTRVVEDLKSLFIGKLNKKTGAVIEPPLWSKLEAAQLLPEGSAAGSAAQRQAMDYALASYHQMASQSSTAPNGSAGAVPWLAAVRGYADTAAARRPAPPWPTARWSNVQQHLLYDAQLPTYTNRFTAGGRAGGVPTPYDWPAVGPTKLQQQSAAGTTPAYERNPNIPTAKGERMAFSNPMYDRGFGGKGIERKVIHIDITQLPAYGDIKAFLSKRHMVLKDWDKGDATTADGRTVRIKTELERALAAEPSGGSGHYKALDRLEDFNNRHTSTDRVVLTRNPYDLMTISTGRGPKNCLTMEATKPGTWSKTLAGSLTQGTLGVYIAKRGDPTLTRANANTVVNPYRDVNGSGDTILGSNYTFFGKTAAMPDGVVEQIAKHVDANFNANGQPAGHYRIDPDVYAERLTDIQWTP